MKLRLSDTVSIPDLTERLFGRRSPAELLKSSGFYNLLSVKRSDGPKMALLPGRKSPEA